MSLIVFLALCILGVGFLIYAFFQWTYGDKRNALDRQSVAVRRYRGKERKGRMAR